MSGVETGIPSSSRSGKPQRVLACVLCQQRKVKCDRRFPCANCVKSKAQCVPATLTQRRQKRRFPERELLERLRIYEDLLRQNNIRFEGPQKGTTTDDHNSNQESVDRSEDDRTEETRLDSPKSTEGHRAGQSYKARSFWHTVRAGFRDAENDSDTSNDEERETTVKRAWESVQDNGNHLLFGTRGIYVDLSLSHPNPVQIFRLWQTYLDNVDPLLKVTHTPSLQGRIIEAATDLTKITPPLEALLFGIYCASILSMSEEDCQSVLSSSRDDALTRYQIAVQQALANCGFLQTDDRDCLTALLLYLVTVRHNTIPPIVSSLFGIAIRIAQRMGIHSEHALAKCTILEAEMRRRLWWALVLFDSRAGELANTKPLTLDPTWDCKMPLNVNDADLRPEMKSYPTSISTPTEALFPVLRSEVGEFMRHALFHLEFNSPALCPLAKDLGSTADVENMLEEKYFQSCDQENPIHFMTIWSTRSALAKCKLLEHHAKYSDSSVRQTDTLRNMATTYAIKLLEYDTKIMTSPLVRGFKWLNHFHFPFPAYIHIIQDLKRRPNSEIATVAWEVMSENVGPWLGPLFGLNTPFFTIFSKMVSETWEICAAAKKHPEEPPTLPGIVTIIKNTMAQAAQETQPENDGQVNVDVNMAMDDFSMPPLSPFNHQSLWFGMGMQPHWAMTRPGMFPSVPGQAPMNPPPNWLVPGGHVNWPAQ